MNSQGENDKWTCETGILNFWPQQSFLNDQVNGILQDKLFFVIVFVSRFIEGLINCLIDWIVFQFG